MGFESMVARLLRAGADPNGPVSRGNTPLQNAARLGNPWIVSHLLAAGAKQLQPRDDELSVHMACRNGKTDVVKVLVEAGRGTGVDIVNLPGLSGFRPIHIAAQFKQHAVISVLLKLGADINTLTYNGTLAVQLGDVAGTKLLIEAGAYPRIPDSLGTTALHMASGLCDRRTTSMLLSAGADETHKSGIGNDAADEVAVMLPVVDGNASTRARVAGYLRLLARAPALRARSWLWATHETCCRVEQASSRSGVVPRPGVHVFRPKKRESKEQRTWTPVSAMCRFEIDATNICYHGSAGMFDGSVSSQYLARPLR